MSELIPRFFIGGSVVSLFAVMGGILKPTSFAGLFGAAPSVAIATLGLAVAKEGNSYAGVECRSMVGGAAALFLFSVAACHLILHFRIRAWIASLISLGLWAGAAFVLFHLLN